MRWCDASGHSEKLMNFKVTASVLLHLYHSNLPALFIYLNMTQNTFHFVVVKLDVVERLTFHVVEHP